MNSMSKELSNGFMFSSSASELWKEIKEQFGGCSGTILYELRRRIYSSKQEGDSIAVYYNKVKMLWDELACLKLDIVGQYVDKEKMIAYIMMVQVEQQRALQGVDLGNVDNAVMYTRTYQHGGSVDNGFLDWWPTSTNGGFGRGRSSAVNNVVYPNKYNSDYNTPLGNVIEDSGSSTHVCRSIALFETIKPLKPSMSVRLPDDTNKSDSRSHKVLVVGRQERGLYVLNYKFFSPSAIQHLNFVSSNSNSLNSEPLVNNINKIHVKDHHLNCEEDLCLVCPIAKQQILCFPSSKSLIHVDVWGPYKAVTKTGAKFFIIIVEDHTRSTWAYMIGSKDQTT
ncbi:hypothetical protein LIER_15038 [Lithospermum erythrorhizon]|uniref:Retrotransposon gag domain-containing protein n=1 Tax=Lithospermum erythrorhizon TaxID=34254 RepID=A0AAV3Q2A8_LITER